MPGFTQDVISLLFKADTRQAEAAFRRMQQRGRGMVQWTRNLRAGLMGMNNMMMGAGAVMVAAGVGIRSAMRSTEDYSNAQANLRSVLVSSNIPIRQQQNLMRVADVQAARYGIGMAETSRAMVDMSEAGFNSQEVMRYFPIAAEFATAANMELADATDMLQASMHQFNLQSEEEARQMAGGLLVAARISSTSVPELQQAFRYAAVEAAGLGYNATEVTAALAGLSTVGLRGSIAGTRLRAVLAGLNRISQSTEEVARESGISMEELNGILYDAAGNTLPLRDAFRNLMGIFSRLPTRMQQNQLAVRLFGRYGMSAGEMFANMNGQGEQWEEILTEISDRQEVANNMTQAAEENLRGFGAQMRFARVAAEGFGIAFGEIFTGADQAGEGFGRYLLDLSVATRLANESSRANEQAREQWEALSPEIRRSGQEMREILVALAELIRLGGWCALEIGHLAAEHKKLSIAFLLGGTVLRPLVTSGGVWRGLFSVIGQVDTASVILTNTTGILSRTLGAVGWSGAVLSGLSLGYTLSDLAVWMYDLANPTLEMGNYLRQLKSDVESNAVSWVRYIPILREAVYLFQIIGRFFQTVGGDISDWFQHTWIGAGGEEGLGVFRGARTVAEQRTRIETRAGRGLSYTPSVERRTEMGERIVADRLRDVAAVMRTEGLSAGESLRQFREELRLADLSTQQRLMLASRFESFANRSMESQRDDAVAAERLGISFNRLYPAIEDISTLMQAISQIRVEGGPEGIPTVQDAYVRQGGLLVAASDDVIVNRRRLAQVLAFPSGGTVPSTPAQQVGATSESQHPSTNTETSIRFEIPVNIDGREIARVVGTQILQSDQRRGVAIPPGSRRRVTQSGAR